MPEIWFYHLQRQKLEDVLPLLLEKCLDRKWRVTVQASSEERLEALDQHLWTYQDASFLAHGRTRDGDEERQPIFLTTGPENLNQSRVRCLIERASSLPLFEAGADDYERLILLFDGNDDEELAFARNEWKQLKAAGRDLSYWKQSPAGGWEKQKL